MAYYKEHEPTCTANILGTEYSIYTDVPHGQDDFLESCDGYCDWTVHRIVIAGRSEREQHENFDERRNVCLRHEITHAFLYESGLDQNSTWEVEGEIHPEQMVEWIARQAPKMYKAFRDVGVL